MKFGAKPQQRRIPIKESVKRMLPKPKPIKGRNPDYHWGTISNAYKIGMAARRPFEARWVLCMAFYSGRQYSYFNTNTHTLNHLQPMKGRIRNVDNKLLPFVNKRLANAIKNRPRATVVPATEDHEDIKGAKVGDKAIKNFWRNNRMDTKWRKMHTWRLVTGNGFLDDRWNPEIGPVDRELLAKTGQLKYQGDVDCGVWSPFEILVPCMTIGDDELDDFPWLMKIKWRHNEWIQQHFPERGHQVRSEKLPDHYIDAAGIFGLQNTAAMSDVEGAVVKELYIQPNAKYPDGLFVTGANGVVLEESDYKFNHYHLTHFKDIEIPGIFWGMPLLEAGIPLQKSWNRNTSSVDEFNRVLGKGKGLVPRGANLDALPDDTHGEWLAYDPVYGHKPEIMTLKGLPGTYDLILNILQMSFQDLFSQHEVSRGTNKSDIRSAEMVALLLEQDAHGNIPSFASVEEAAESLFTRILKRIQFGYKTSRVAAIQGKEGQFDIQHFKGADIRNNTDVYVLRESSLPDSRVARRAEIRENYAGGLYGDPMNPEVRRHVANLLEDAVVEDIYSDQRQDERNARIENQTMASGQVAQLLPNVYDNHMVHHREHYRYLKSRDVQNYKLRDRRRYNQIVSIILKHDQYHTQAIKNQQERMIRSQAAAKGARR